MALQKKPLSQDDDNLLALQRQDEEQWAQFGELAEETYKKFWEYNDGKSGKQAKSTKEGGRDCVRCAGRLKVFEHTDEGYLLLQCKSCGFQQWETDIMPYSADDLKELEKEAKKLGVSARHIPDELYRTIPDNLVLEYTQMRKQSLGIK